MEEGDLEELVFPKTQMPSSVNLKIITSLLSSSALQSKEMKN
jgi:hypothetical protein